jgi:putative tricarboxylic transport membrane protein
MPTTRRTFLNIVASSTAALTTAGPALAQIKGLEIMAPAGPGGGYDQLARAMQQVLQSDGLASSVQVQNVPGAGGTIGLAQLVNTKKGRAGNLMVCGFGLVGAVLTNKSPVNLAQATPIARLQGEYQPLVVAASSPIKTIDDLIKKFKSEPGSVSWGGFALGSPDHVLTAMIVQAAGGDVAKMNYIVAGAGGEMLAQVMGGHITVATGGYNEFEAQIKAGKLRALGISSPERLPGIDVPTFKEQGVDVVLANWRGVVAPPNIKAEDKRVLEEAVAKVAKSEAWKKILNERGQVDLYMPAAEFGAFIKEEQSRIGTLMKQSGMIN